MRITTTDGRRRDGEGRRRLPLDAEQRRDDRRRSSRAVVTDVGAGRAARQPTAAAQPLLVVTAGLPATGKSTIAEVVGNRLGLPVLSVDPIEAAILSAGIDSAQPTGLAAYLVAETMAEGVLAERSRRRDRRGQRRRAGPRAVGQARGAPGGDAALHRGDLLRPGGAPRAPRGPRRTSRRRPTPRTRSSRASRSGSRGPASRPPCARVTLDSVQPLGVNIEQALEFLNS